MAAPNAIDRSRAAPGVISLDKTYAAMTAATPPRAAEKANIPRSWPSMGLASLSFGFIDDQGSSNRNIQRIDFSSHRDFDVNVRLFQPELTQALVFSSHCYGQRPAHILPRIIHLCLRRRCKNPDFIFTQKSQGIFIRRFYRADGKQGAARSPHHIGIEDIDARIADH